MKAKIIAVGCHKGGVSKTTTVANLGSILARRGYKMLLVDLDLLNKIRHIASRKGLWIKEVNNAAFEKAIKNYELKHGVIEDDGRSNVGNLF